MFKLQWNIAKFWAKTDHFKAPNRKDFGIPRMLKRGKIEYQLLWKITIHKFCESYIYF